MKSRCPDTNRADNPQLGQGPPCTSYTIRAEFEVGDKVRFRDVEDSWQVGTVAEIVNGRPKVKAHGNPDAPPQFRKWVVSPRAPEFTDPPLSMKPETLRREETNSSSDSD